MAQPGHANESYEEYIEKFKTKHTKDDTFTPPRVYDAIRDWAVREYGLEGREIVRPFWPGADYTQAEYPEGCVVLDNPPYSMMSKICRFYTDRGIDFFLFANHVTLFNSLNNSKVNAVVTGNSVEFENGAKIPVSFLTNMGEDRVIISGDLYSIIEKAIAHEDRSLRKVCYPPNIVSAARFTKFAKLGMNIRIRNMEYHSSVGNYHLFGGGDRVEVGGREVGGREVGGREVGGRVSR